MGTAFRIFFVNADNTVRRVSLARFNRLFLGESDEAFPEYAGQRVRYLLLFLETEGRRPLRVIRADFAYVQFNTQGRRDMAAADAEIRLLMSAMPTSGPQRTGIIEAGHEFLQRQVAHELRWEPTPEIANAVRALVFGPGER